MIKNQDLDDRSEVQDLFSNLKNKLSLLERLLQKSNEHWEYEDPIYRFYHQSHKVYGLQILTNEIVSMLQSLMPDSSLNSYFNKIIQEGTNKTFSIESNEDWLQNTRTILEAFFHAKFFLEMAVKYGNEFDAPPNLLPSGWAAFLYLYNLR